MKTHIEVFFHMKFHLRVQPAFESLGKGLSGTENRFELWLLFVEKLGFEKITQFFVYCSTTRSTVEIKIE